MPVAKLLPSSSRRDGPEPPDRLNNRAEQHEKEQISDNVARAVTVCSTDADRGNDEQRRHSASPPGTRTLDVFSSPIRPSFDAGQDALHRLAEEPKQAHVASRLTARREYRWQAGSCVNPHFSVDWPQISRSDAVCARPPRPSRRANRKFIPPWKFIPPAIPPAPLPPIRFAAIPVSEPSIATSAGWPRRSRKPFRGPIGVRGFESLPLRRCCVSGRRRQMSRDVVGSSGSPQRQIKVSSEAKDVQSLIPARLPRRASDVFGRRH